MLRIPEMTKVWFYPEAQNYQRWNKSQMLSTSTFQNPSPDGPQKRTLWSRVDSRERHSGGQGRLRTQLFGPFERALCGTSHHYCGKRTQPVCAQTAAVRAVLTQAQPGCCCGAEDTDSMAGIFLKGSF